MYIFIIVPLSYLLKNIIIKSYKIHYNKLRSGIIKPKFRLLRLEELNQDSPVVSHNAKKKQHAHAQLTQLLVCYL